MTKSRSLTNWFSAGLRRISLAEDSREREEKFRALAVNATAAIFVIDQESTILFANPAATRIFGYDSGELIGKCLEVLMPERERQLHHTGIRRYLATGQRNVNWEGVELPGKTKDGRMIPLEISFGEFVRDGKRFFTGIVRDISDRKRAEEERLRFLESEQLARAEAEEAHAEAEQRRAELERLTESRAQLMRGFTHDVKNPLGAAAGLLDILEDGTVDGLSAKQKDHINRARHSIGTALELIDHLLELARAEAGELQIENAPTAVGQIAQEVVQEQRAQADTKGLALKIEVSKTLPSIDSDPNRVRQILGNLVSNAIKYTEKGSVTVRVEAREGGKAPGPGRWVAVDVTDTGPGIPENQQGLLFQEFRRLETAGDERGLGIGLAISRRIARALGGDVTVHSEVGRGSTFVLWLPLSDAKAARPASLDGVVDD